MEAWSGFVEMETAEQNIEAARGIFRRCYTHVLEGAGQVRSFCMLANHAYNALPRNVHCADSSWRLQPMRNDHYGIACSALCISRSFCISMDV